MARFKTFAPRAHERGAILLVTFLFAITILAFSTTLISAGVAASQQKRALVAKNLAAETAESGMHHLVAGLNGSMQTTILSSGRLSGTLAGTGERRLRYECFVRSAALDLADNDLNGLIDEPAEQQMYEAVSVGLADGVDCAVGATLRRLSPTMSMPGALLWDNPTATLQLDSTGDQTDLTISGIDKDLAGNPTGGIAPGIAVNGNHLPLKNSIPSPRYDADIVGLGGNKSVAQMGASTMDYQSLIDFARTNYDIRLDKQGYPNVNIPYPWGTPDNPMVVYAKGDSFGDHVDLDKRKVIGAGILVVDGSLEVGDAEAVLDWKGIVIVRSKLLIDDAYVNILGGMVMYGPYQHSQIDDGNITIQYSTEALARALQVLGPTGYVVLNWRQAPVPPAARAALAGGY